MKAILNNKWMLPVILALMTLLTSALLMFSHEMTVDKIAAIKSENKLASLKKLLPANLIDNDLIADAIDIEEPVLLGHRHSEKLYLGKKNGQITVMGIPVTAQNGYSGDIDLLVGVLSNGQITAVEIINHKETPGLGDLIESRKSDWLLQFPNKSLNEPTTNQWLVKKDRGHFDQITAATITPRAVVGAIKKALLYHQTWLSANAEAFKP
ncbi:electron transport complex subunit RsxG [Marinicella litoralis]|uniref:Ion-translocating oxidoreductase complex subunit G n=1 Tax=Marinicella litoralis TaxID=644220 RepID=A0A4R6XMK3_9GAMM|nr:electron transport complex subunit RsxG [Marinicella litoralis]TDR20826.1 electron transport complex protein RnfG [Marinicella litoralis]